MKWSVRNKTAEKRLKRAIFKLLVLSYMNTILYFSFCNSKHTNKFEPLKVRKFESTNMVLTHLKILIFPTFHFKLGGRGVERVEKNVIHFKMKIYVCFRFKT